MIEAEAIKQLVNENEAAYMAYYTLANAGGTIYIVGGAVRDLFLGKEPKDLDLLVSGLHMEQISELLKNTGGNVNYTGTPGRERGNAFGVLLFRLNSNQVEIALPRIEYSTGDTHHDFDVEYDPDIPIELDLGRRDFTANSMAINLNALEQEDYANMIIDPHNGMQDIFDNKLKLVNKNALNEDPLRILRAIVAYAKHGLTPDKDLEEALQENADKIRNLPGDRIRMELDKLLSSDDPAKAIELAAETGVLDYVIPEVASALGFDQKNPNHDLDVGQHLLASLKAISKLTDDIDVRLASLLHDIGKPDSQWVDENGIGHYYEHENFPESANHEELGAEMAREFMSRLNYSNERIDKVEKLIKNHMFDYYLTPKATRKHLNNIGGDYDMAQNLLYMREADARGKKSGDLPPEDEVYLTQANDLLRQEYEKANALSVAGLAINGHDLIELGMQPGPQLGQTLDNLLEMVLEDPQLNTREELLEIAKGMING